MRISTFEQFLSKIDEFVGDAENVIVATYGKIAGYSDGITDGTTKNGKRLKVIAGGGAFNGYIGFDMVPHRDPDVAGVQATKDAGVGKVSDELSTIPKSAFIILYAGTSRLQKMVDLTALLAQKGTKVVLLGCGCDGPERFSDIDDSPYKGDITIVIPSRAGYCDSAWAELGEIVSQIAN